MRLGMPVALLLGLAVMMLAGCVAPEAPPAVPEAPAGQQPAAEDPATTPGDPPRPSNDSLPAAAVDLAWKESTIGTATLHARILLDAPAPDDAPPLQLRFTWDGQDADTVDLALDAARRNATWTHERNDTAGSHEAALALAWGDGPPIATTSEDITLHMPVTLTLRADTEYAEDQNVFHSTFVLPALPDATSALDLLANASALYDFPYHATYRSDFDAHYVDMINDTEEEWVVRELGISHSWMLLHEGETGGQAADHIHPAANETVEFRFVRCYATGHCDGLED